MQLNILLGHDHNSSELLDCGEQKVSAPLGGSGTDRVFGPDPLVPVVLLSPVCQGLESGELEWPWLIRPA